MTKQIATLADLTPDVKNANRGTSRGRSMVEKSLHSYGAGRSILVDRNGQIIAGNKTTEAAAAIGLDDVQVVQTDGKRLVVVQRTDLDLDSDAAARELAIADNRAGELGLEWDAETLAEIGGEIDLSTFWSRDELAELLKQDVAPGDGGDNFDTTPEDGPTRVQPGDLWQLGRHRLLCGDSTKREDVERLMQGERADCVFTSPPYAVGVDYGEYDDTMDNLRQMLPQLAEMWRDVVFDGGFAVVNFGDIAPARNIAGTDEPCEYPMALEYWPVFRAHDWLLWSRRIWCKPNPRVHSLQCIGSNRAATDWEHIWTWKRPGRAIVERVDGDYRSPLGWIDTSKQEGVSVGKETHGAGMAVSIAEHMINVHSRPNSVVYEPFCGTGTSIVATHRLGRYCYAMEQSPQFADVILRRYEAETGQEAVKVDG